MRLGERKAGLVGSLLVAHYGKTLARRWASRCAGESSEGLLRAVFLERFRGEGAVSGVCLIVFGWAHAFCMR